MTEESVSLAGDDQNESQSEKTKASAGGEEGTSLKPADRVKRKTEKGCVGTVQDVRSEVIASTIDPAERALLVSVLWDNGTLSYFTPDALEVVR